MSDNPRTSAAPSPRPGDRSLLELLGELETLTDAITSRNLDELDGPGAAEASLRVHRATDRLRATQLGWLGIAESAGVWFGTGARTFRTWVARTHDVSFAEAGRWIRPARAWRDFLPATATAARLGHVPVAKGALIAATASTPERIDALQAAVGSPDEPTPDPAGSTDPSSSARSRDTDVATGEETLLGLAPGYDVDQFAKITRRFSHVVDPEADERGYRDALAKEFFDLAATTGGYHLSGFLTMEHGQLVKTALRAVTGTPAAGDARTPGQRRAAGLASLSRLVLDKGLTGKVGTVRPHLSVHVTFTELAHLMSRARRASEDAPAGGSIRPPLAPDGGSTGPPVGPEGDSTGPSVGTDGGSTGPPVGPDGGSSSPSPAPPGSRDASGGPVTPSGQVGLAGLLTAPPAEWEDGSGPIPDGVLRRLAADCEITRVIFGPESQVLDVGRTSRTFTGHLRRAVVARDRACVVDGCGAPPSIGQIHHATTRWADGGSTSTDNAALVCAFHNQWLEDYQVPMSWIPDATAGGGRWHIGEPGTYRSARAAPGSASPP